MKISEIVEKAQQTGLKYQITNNDGASMWLSAKHNIKCYVFSVLDIMRKDWEIIFELEDD